MKELTVLTIKVEISDQYGTSKDILVGVFDHPFILENAKKSCRIKYKHKRHSFTEKIVKINEVQKPES